MLDLHRRLEVLSRSSPRRGSIAAAAQELGVSPSAVSQQLSALEREAQLPLIERTAHSASLTDAGKEPGRARHHDPGCRCRGRGEPDAGSVRHDRRECPGELHPRAGGDGGPGPRRAPAPAPRAQCGCPPDRVHRSFGRPPGPGDGHRGRRRVGRGGRRRSPRPAPGPSARAREAIVLAVPADHPVALSHFQKPVSAATLRGLSADRDLAELATRPSLAARRRRSAGGPRGHPGAPLGVRMVSTSWHGSSPSGSGITLLPSERGGLRAPRRRHPVTAADVPLRPSAHPDQQPRGPEDRRVPRGDPPRATPPLDRAPLHREPIPSVAARAQRCCRRYCAREVSVSRVPRPRWRG